MPTRRNKISEIISFTPPTIHKGKEWYIYWRSYNPEKGKLCPQKIMLNFIKSKRMRLQYGQDLILRLYEELRSGWNPFIEPDYQNNITTFGNAAEKYRTFIEKKLKDGIYREDTYTGYLSYLKNLEEYNKPIGSVYFS